MVNGLFWIFLLLIAYTYLIYPALVIFISKFISLNSKVSRAEYPTVAMVVPAYNEDDCLQEKIDNCLEIDYPTDRIEFIFGSDGSSDGTNQILKANSNQAIKDFVFSKREGKIRVLNKLISDISSKDDIIFFVGGLYMLLAVLY